MLKMRRVISSFLAGREGITFPASKATNTFHSSKATNTFLTTWGGNTFLTEIGITTRALFVFPGPSFLWVSVLVPKVLVPRLLAVIGSFETFGSRHERLSVPESHQ